MKSHVKMFLLYLPLMALLAIVGWTLLGVLPGATMTGDEVAWLLELPIVTCYALAAGGATILTMQLTGMNLPNELRAELLARATSGDTPARRALIEESLAWIVILLVWAVFFFPHW